MNKKVLNIKDAIQYLDPNKKFTAFVTGVTGQDGSYMVEYLLEHTDMIVFGGVRRLSVSNHKNIAHINNDRFHLVNFDLSDAHSIRNVIRLLQPDYFINLAAQSFVHGSWDLARQTWDVNATAVLDILEAIRSYCSHCRAYLAGCHDTQTKIVTPEGIKTYDQVNIGDLVYSINPTTKDLELKKIMKVFEYDYNGNLMVFKRNGLAVTPNHNMLYKTKKNRIMYKQAIDFISLADVKYPINNPFNGKKLSKTINLSKHIPIAKKRGNSNYGKHITQINTYDLMYLIGLYIGDGSCRIMKRKHFVQVTQEQRKRDSNGRYTNNDKNLPYITAEYKCPQTIIDIPSTDKNFHKVIKTLDRNQIKWTLHGSCDITFHQWGLIPYFTECGHSASTKRVPNWIFALDAIYQQKVLEGIMDSDGDKRHTIYTASEQLQFDLIKLNINCGIMPTFRQRPPRKAVLKDGRIIKGNFPEHIVHSLQVNTGYQRGNWKNYPYNGKVWCLEVEDNHNFLVTRNGKLTFSGNSSEENGNVLYSPQDENHPPRPRSPYGASKAASRLLAKVYRESYHLYVVQGWLLNHESSRRGTEFVTRKISQGVARISKELRHVMNSGIVNTITPLELGNLDAKRDWSYAPDFIKAIWLMLNQEKPKDYVVSSGENHSIREFVERAFNVVGLEGRWAGEGLNEKYFVHGYPVVIINPDFYRPAEVDVLLGDSKLIRKELGWKPEVSFDQLVEIMVKHDVENLD